MPNPVISVIDDDPAVREGTADLLNSAGFLTKTFNDAEAFLKSGNVDGSSCLVADMRMPKMSGLELHNQLLKAGKNIPTILITAFPKNADRAQARELGVCGYLSKPFSENDLLSHICLALSARREDLAAVIGNLAKTDRKTTAGERHDISAISKLGDVCRLPEQAPPETVGAKQSLFHEHWWLSAVTDGHYEESVVKQGSEVVGRLPYVAINRGPFRTIRMPPFTHLLGPIINSGAGKHQTRLSRRLSITRSLVDQLPVNSFFLQHLDPSLDDGLASADALAFQECKFYTAPQYTFKVDCRLSPDELWAAMNQKTRQPIRRAEEQFSVRNIHDPRYFIDFYIENSRARGQANRLDFRTFPALFSECHTRDCGLILGAFDHDATPVAMTYLVWGHGTMYYLLSTRSQTSGYGAVSLLLWSAMRQANRRGLILDLDGVYSTGTARFLSSFGGQIKARITIRKTDPAYHALQLLKRQYSQDDTKFFT